jgi:hypothetical protein
LAAAIFRNRIGTASRWERVRKDISLEAKARLMNLYIQLNPAELRRRIDQKTAKLWKLSR